MMKTLSHTLLVSLLFLAAPSFAEIQKFGDVDVNYNVITTDTLSPQMAKAYGITRSNRRGLLTVAVSKPNELGLPKPVAASVKASTVNMIEQHRDIKIRSIHEGTAIYYIGEFAFATPDFLRFTLSIAEKAGGKPFKIEFQKNYDNP